MINKYILLVVVLYSICLINDSLAFEIPTILTQTLFNSQPFHNRKPSSQHATFSFNSPKNEQESQLLGISQKIFKHKQRNHFSIFNDEKEEKFSVFQRSLIYDAFIKHVETQNLGGSSLLKSDLKTFGKAMSTHKFQTLNNGNSPDFARGYNQHKVLNVYVY